jgi:hypothetical protein
MHTNEPNALCEKNRGPAVCIPLTRSKRFAKERQTWRQRNDPEQGNHTKVVSRVINASEIREQYREKKRKLVRQKLTANKDNRTQGVAGKMKGEQVESHSKTCRIDTTFQSVC